ncbi:MAG TPA: DUF1684 domain-containing protein [Thermoanaerobaculia bacterium]|nr:DUF1684 domain-containing protein [Thermoanaerobaculia bacterium]
MTFDAAAHAAEIEAWRRRRRERLTGDDGWLSLTGLFWLADGPNAVGAAPDAAIRLPPAAPDRAGTILLSEGRAVFAPADPAPPGLSADGRPVEGPVALRTDAGGEPTGVAIRGIRFHLLERGGRIAVRVRDRGNPARSRLGAIPSFPIDPAWRFDARFEPYDPPRRMPVTSVVGTVEEETVPGAVAFDVGSSTFRLEPVLERGETDYWIVFGDATNGVETYGGGRFVYVSPPVGGRTVLDFNRAYNPPCVFTPYSTCPLPAPRNRLSIRIEAGEKLYRP